MSNNAFPSFRKVEFLEQHIKDILAFYAPNVDDKNGGFYQNFMDDGSVFDKQTRHLVSSTRFVFNYARAYLHFNQPQDLERVKSGLNFLQTHHFNPQTKGYKWLISVNNGKSSVLDDTNHCYGLAFVILAYSWAIKAGLEEQQNALYECFTTMEKHFWDETAGLYKDEANSDFSIVDAYRGQNANMHSCEALIAAYEATKDSIFLERALLIAKNITKRQAAKANNWIWEHYNHNWEVDWDYNKTDPKNLFRPWGYQPGHHTEWAKLLCQLSMYCDDAWIIRRAQSLFDSVINIAWDTTYGGICYGFSPTGEICDADKYFWVQAESFAAAARLALCTGEEKYWQWYEKIWGYAWQHLVDHKYGAWFRILSPSNQKLEATKSPVGKTDYHTMGACYDVIDALKTYS